ncbi:hypothetical protein H2201_000212 [Coniosporium apollinis]|uniref:RanBD1 domain-containing protein n=1 Tax=Coniosporium apollinis TaxID=61459 RepID=A0ABQ9P5G0_9PEZI|nr:hypothetical protein H2201_000212 [Coniosporium apollinis]
MARSTQRSGSPQAPDEPTSRPKTVTSSVVDNGAAGSDTEGSERQAREKLRATSIAGLPIDNIPASDAPMEDAVTEGEANKGLSDQPAENMPIGQHERGRLRRKRSIEDVEEGHPTEEPPTGNAGRHVRKRSRDIRSSQHLSRSGSRKTSGEQSVQEISEHEMPDEETQAAPKNTMMNGTISERPTSPLAGSDQQNGKDFLTSPKNKRTRDEFLLDQEKASKVENEPKPTSHDPPSTEVQNGLTAQDKSAPAEEPKTKRHRDSNSPQPAIEREESTVTKIPPTSGFANTSATSPFSALAGNKSPSASSQTSETAFKASGFGALAGSSISGFGALGSSTGGTSPFGGVAASNKATSGFGAATPAASSAGSGFGGLLGSAKPSFASASSGTSGFGSLAGGLGGGFGGLSGGGLSSFAAPGASSIVGLSDKPARPFGAAADDDEEGGEAGHDEEEAVKSPRTDDDEGKDRRFYEQDVETGEENERILFSCRAKLYNFVNTSEDSDKKEWKERGTGTLRLNVQEPPPEEDQDGEKPRKARFVMRADGSHRVVLNTPVKKELKVGDFKGNKPTGQFVMFWGSHSGAKLELMQLKMKTSNAEELWRIVTQLQEEIFIVADTSDPPEYVALPYVWGEASNTVPISIDGKVVHVTQNLKGALQFFSITPALLWADALCINQQDIPEKNQQVNMMATIYRKAANVTVWLGPDEHNDAPAAIVDPDEEEKARLERLFKLPWFSRTWTLQEVGLAPDAVALWGGLAIEWNPIGLTAMFLQRHCKALLGKLGLRTEIERVFHIYTAFSLFITRATFFHVINNARQFNATDPRDKVFALLSHPTAHTTSMTTISLNWNGFKPALPMAFRLLPSFHDQFFVKTLAEERTTSYTPPSELPPPLLQADYYKTTEKIYRNLALDHINRTKGLEILTAVQHDPESTSNLFTPSWVPRWDYFIDTPILGLHNSTHFASANRDIILNPPHPNIENTLTVRGTLVTRIVDHMDLLEPSSFDLPLPATIVGLDSPLVQGLWHTNPIAKTWVLNLSDEDPESYPVLPLYTIETGNGPYAFYNTIDSNVYNAYVRTWVAGKNIGEIDGFDLKADSAAYRQRLVWVSQGTPQTFVSKLMSSQSSKEEWTVKGLQDKMRWQRYRDSAVLVCNKRKIFFTKKKLFGLGPGALRPGDFIAVLLGADVPFVVREVPDDEEEDEVVGMRENKPVLMDRKF